MTGTDYPIPECQIALHQPTISEIGLIGENNFFTAIQTLIIDKQMLDMGESDLSNISNFQIFMMIMNEAETKDKKEMILDLLKIMLPTQQIIFSPQSIIITGSGQNIIIDEKNFEVFQEAIKNIFGLKNSLNNQNVFNPSDEMAKKIAEKIMKGRQKIAQEKGGSNGSVFVQYLSVLSIALHLSINELKNYTVFQLYDSIERFGLWSDFDLDIKSRLAGGNPKNSPENWMKNIH